MLIPLLKRNSVSTTTYIIAISTPQAAGHLLKGTGRTVCRDVEEGFRKTVRVQNTVYSMPHCTQRLISARVIRGRIHKGQVGWLPVGIWGGKDPSALGTLVVVAYCPLKCTPTWNLSLCPGLQTGSVQT